PGDKKTGAGMENVFVVGHKCRTIFIMSIVTKVEVYLIASPRRSTSFLTHSINKKSSLLQSHFA
ncbi:MAG: hypothetical protein LBB91_05100, partial [Clostridiales bacterium]|nr:hypothetical protein [Clostridiales bacterium]